MPNNWAITSFEEIVELISGRDLETSSCNDIKEGIPYLIGASNIVKRSLFITRWTTKPIVISQKNDILISCKGTIGEVIRNTIGDIHIARQFMALRNNSIVDTNYIELYIRAILERIKSDARGVIPGISREDILCREILLPPLNEQKRIVLEASKLISIIEKINVDKNELVKAIAAYKLTILQLAITGKLVPQDLSDEPAIDLLRRVNPNYKPCDNRHYGNTKITIPRNWCWVKLGEIFDVVSAKRVFQSEWQKTGIPFYRAREIVKLSNCGHVDNELYISIEHFESLKNKYGAPEADDIMLSAVGTIGKCYIVNKNDRFYYKDASVLCLKNIHNLNSEYIKFVLDSSVVQMQMQDQSKGTTVDTITIEKAKGYYIPLPPVTEQSRIVKAITLINHTIDKIAAIL